VNTTDLRALAERAEAVEGRQSVRLEELHGRIRAARRRRATGALGIAALAMVVAGTAFLFRPDGERSTPTPDPTPTPSIPSPVVEDEAVVRPLTYGEGQKIHYGDKVFDTGQPITQIDVVDAGVVYMTEGSGIWFTDGEQRRRIDARVRSNFDVNQPVAAAVGSRIAYLRTEDSIPVSVVVYDVGSGEVVLEAPAGPSAWPDFDVAQPEAQAMFLTSDQVVVYYSDDTEPPGRDYGQVRYISYDLGTGEQTEVPLDAPDTIEVAPPARRLEWRARAGNSESLVRGSTDTFRVRDGALTVDVFDDSVGVWRVADPIDPVTGERLIIPLPAGVAPRTELKLFQWLDDGVFALVRMITRTTLDDGDLVVVCRLSVLTCDVAVEGAHHFILPGRAFYE
jgi:hypothetical protein